MEPGLYRRGRERERERERESCLIIIIIIIIPYPELFLGSLLILKERSSASYGP